MLSPNNNDGYTRHSDEEPVSSGRSREYVPMSLNPYILTEREKVLVGNGYELVRLYSSPFDEAKIREVENYLSVDRNNLEQCGYEVVVIKPENLVLSFTMSGVKAPLNSSYRLWRKKAVH